jgi:hypothetical protein
LRRSRNETPDNPVSLPDLKVLEDDMSDNYEAWISAELAFRKRACLNRIDEIEHILDGLRDRIENDSYLNELGELQQAGPMLDAAIAAYAVQRQTLKNYREMAK